MTNITWNTFNTLVHTVTAATQRRSAQISRVIRNWDEQGTIHRLCTLDDRLLRDAGLDRCDIEWASQLPLSVSPKDALATRIRRT